MRVQPVQKPGRSKQDYATPACFLSAVKQRFGVEFAIDLAADATNAVCARYLSMDDDALSVEWRGLWQG